MNYPNTIGFPSDGESIEEIADRISQSSTAEVKPRLTSGLERDGDQRTYSAADFLEKEPRSPALEPSTGGGSSAGPRPYQHSARISSAHDQIRDAHRRPEWNALGTPEIVAEAWEIVLEKIAAAKDAMATIPVVMRKAEADRAAALADAKEPTVLPSPGDARAWAEQQALSAIAAARAARVKYDRLVEENLEEHAANLAASVPTEVEAITARVAGLRASLVALREGVRAVVEVESARVAGHRGKSMPIAVRLDVLDKIEEELAALRSIAEEPTEIKLVPSLKERAAIAAQARQVVGGITASIIRLARVEAGERYEHTAYTRGIPQHVLENAENSARYGV